MIFFFKLKYKTKLLKLVTTTQDIRSVNKCSFLVPFSAVFENFLSLD